VCNKMQTGEKMYEQVARHASSVIEIVSPPEETRSIKFSLCGIAYERLPIHCLFRSIGRNGILPCTDGGVACPESFCVIQCTDGSIIQYFFRLLISKRRNSLASYHENFSGIFLGLDGRMTFANRMYHRLFAIHVFACFQCID